MAHNLDLGSIYEAHAPAIRRYLLRHTHDEDIADELLSQVFECACRDAHAYEDRGFPVTSWLYSLAHCRLIDHIRRGRRRRSIPIEDCTLTTEGGFERAEGRVDAAPVVALLHQLPPEQRAVLILRFLEDRSLGEVAAQFGRSVGAVKALQHRGLRNAQLLLGMSPASQTQTCWVCGNPIHAQGLCVRHYRQQQRHPDRQLPPWERAEDQATA